MGKLTKDNAMLIDIQYVRRDIYSSQNTDYLYIIWKDLDTNEKHLEIVKNPTMDIYFEKMEYRNHDYNKNYTPLDRVYKKNVRYKNVAKEIANEAGGSISAFYNDCMRLGNYRDVDRVHMYPYVFASDYPIDVFYRYKWKQLYTNNREKPITKGFLDIEVDLTNATGFPTADKDPIDLISFLDATHNTMYTFILTGIESFKDKSLSEKRMKLQEYYTAHPDELIDIIHETFDESYPNIEYKLYFYKDELKMLVHLFQLINTLKLDFLGIWNMRFDAQYFINRFIALGVLDPTEIMCHPDFPAKKCYFKEDHIQREIKNQSDYFDLSSYTVWWCQMRTYASIRKGQSELRNNKLGYISQIELNDEKLNYEEEGDLQTLSLSDWLKYILYNIKDVLLQGGIDDKTGDLNTLYFTSYENLVPYKNVFKQTVVLRNVAYESFLEQGLVPGNNINKFKYSSKEPTNNNETSDEDEVGFEGALVGNPLLNGEFGLELYGKRTNNIFEFSIDFDMSAFYPSCIRACNIDASTLIFKIIILPEQFDVRGGKIPYRGITDEQLVKTNKDSFKDDIAKELLDNFQTGNYLSLGYKWFNLPSVNEMESYLLNLRNEG